MTEELPVFATDKNDGHNNGNGSTAMIVRSEKPNDDIKKSMLMDFFRSQGAIFVNAETGEIR